MANRVMRLAAVACVLLAVAPPSASAAKVKVAKGKLECIHAVLENIEDFEWENSDGMEKRLENEFMLGEVNAALEIPGKQDKLSIELKDPKGKVVWRVGAGEVQLVHKFSIPTKGGGTYSLCFDNTNTGILSGGEVDVTVVYFMLKHLMDDPEVVTAPAGREALRSSEVVTAKHTAGISDHVREIDELLAKLRGEQKYMRMRIERHLKTQKSTAARVSMLSYVEFFVLVAISAMQVIAVRRLFAGKESMLPGRAVGV